MNQKGFQSFVNSIITNNVKLKSKQDKPAAVVSQPPQANELNDLALIQQLQGKSDENASKAQSRKNQESRPKGIGLGYEKHITEAEIEANNQISKLKKQLQRENDDKKQQEISQNQSKITQQEGKHGIKEKSKVRDEKHNMIHGNQEKKRLKKEKQKQKKVDQKQKEDLEQSEKNESQIHPNRRNKINANDQDGDDDSAERKHQDYKKVKYREVKSEDGTTRMRRRTKTRSKQKNKKRDNRPEELKRAKLAEKGINI